MINPPIVTNPLFSSTFFFRDPGSSLSWSEKYFISAVPDTDTAHIAGLNLCNLRTGMNVKTIVTLAVRTSDEHIQRDAWLTEGGQTFKGNQLTQFSDLDHPAEMPYSTVLVREAFGSKYHAQRYVSGIPDLVIVDPPGPAPLADWTTAFEAFKNALFGIAKKKGLAGFPWGFLAISKEAADQVPTDVLGVVLLNGQLVISVKAVHVEVGDCVKVYNAKWNPKPASPGYLQVTAIDNVLQKVTCNFSGGIAPLWLSGGSLRRLRLAQFNITSYELRGETHHKRGGRFFLPVGRAKRRA